MVVVSSMCNIADLGSHIIKVRALTMYTYSLEIYGFNAITKPINPLRRTEGWCITMVKLEFTWIHLVKKV